MELTKLYREKVRVAVLDASTNYGGSDSSYAKTLGLQPSVYSRLKNGETERLISDTKWLTWGRELNVSLKANKWNVVRTEVYNQIENNLQFCQSMSKSMILADDCGIGKTFCARNISRSMKNAFYFDCSQAKTKQQFIRLLAKAVGVENTGKYVDVKMNLKYCLNSVLTTPLVILDEAGDLEYTAFLELKELWNATENQCAWYLMGADGLRAKIKKGIRNEKVGYAEIFDRFSGDFVKLTPIGKEDRTLFYQQLIGDVANANATDKNTVNRLVNKCLKKTRSLRHLDTLIKLQ